MSRRALSREIVEAARAYLRVPFRHQGRSRTGLDCMGLGVCAFRDVGLAVSDTTAYGRTPDWRRLMRETDRQLIRLPLDTELSAGLVAFFHDDEWTHFGMMTGPRSFIHARGPEGGKVVEHILDDQSWHPRLVALWRHPEMIWENP